MQVVAGLLLGKNSFIWFGVLALRGDAQTDGVEQKTPNEAKKNSQNLKHFSLKDFAGFLPISKSRRRLSLDFSPTSSDRK